MVDDNLRCVNSRNDTAVIRPHDHARVLPHNTFHARTHQWGFCPKQWHSLSLHIRTHQSPVGIVVLQKWDKRSRNTNNLFGRNIDKVDIRVGHLGQFPFHSCEDETFFESALLDIHRARRGKDLLHFLIRT